MARGKRKKQREATEIRFDNGSTIAVAPGSDYTGFGIFIHDPYLIDWDLVVTKRPNYWMIPFSILVVSAMLWTI